MADTQTHPGSKRPVGRPRKRVEPEPRLFSERDLEWAEKAISGSGEIGSMPSAIEKRQARVSSGVSIDQAAFLCRVSPQQYVEFEESESVTVDAYPSRFRKFLSAAERGDL